jgi:hypothetical protein
MQNEILKMQFLKARQEQLNEVVSENMVGIDYLSMWTNPVALQTQSNNEKYGIHDMEFIKGEW